MRRKAAVKAEVLHMVVKSPLPVRQTLKELKLSSATYCRWRRRYAERGLEGLQDLSPRARRVWNRLREERGFIVAYSLEHLSLNPREIAARLVDLEGRFVSESTVRGFSAEREYRGKATGPNQLWHTDASYFFVVGWGYYYLITVLDDYFRMVLAWRVQPSMGSGRIIEVVQDAVEFTGLLTVPVEPGSALLVGNGPGFLGPSRSF